MARWVRNLVMCTVLGAWVVTVAATLLQGKLPDAVFLGIPGGVYVLLADNPLSIIRRPPGRRRAAESEK